MNTLKIFLLLALFAPLTGLKADNLGNETVFKTCMKSCDTDFDAISFDFSLLAAKRDATLVAQKGLFPFFMGALKAVAVWGAVKLIPLVLSKIRLRARTYSERYYSDPGVYQAGQHWDDMIQRSGTTGCHIGPEPDHDTSKPGFQGTDDCPICSKQALDLKNT